MEVYCACARETSTTSKKVEMARGAFERKMVQCRKIVSAESLITVEAAVCVRM